jgi:membrane protein required for colicin V production
MNDFNGLDYLLIFGAAAFALLGIYWGLIRQVLALVGLLVGVAVAGRYGPDVAGWLSSFVSDPRLAGALGFLLVLGAVSTTASLIASVLHTFAGLLFLGWLDHLLGGLLGLLQAVLAGAVVLTVLAAFPQPAWSDQLAGSQLAGGLLQIGALFAPLLPALNSGLL